ncbi:MAG: hypothetical protein FWF60_07310, partial [Oscillospiraceae bacterium]|nr:hypothetical protein [Oscillospiraceae bacterium]
VKRKQKTARQSLKTTRRRLVAGMAVFALLVSAALMLGFNVIDSKTPIAYYDGLIDMEAFEVYRDDLYPGSGMRGDCLKVQLARQPRFEYSYKYGGIGSINVEDVVTIDGQRVGVAYVQMLQNPLGALESERKANANGGRNPDITSYGYTALQLTPMSEKEKEAFRAWGESMGEDSSGIDESQFANWSRDIPITRLYYYSGPTKKLVNEALGWSQRNGVFENSVLLWEAGSGQEFHTEYRPQIEGETRPAD